MTEEQKDIIESLCVNEGYLQNWYMDSVGYYDDPKLNEPVWTDEHLKELFKDFYLIPKDNGTGKIK